MPQLTERFGPIPSQVVLDGSGNGTVQFQPNGSNARITNLMVKVSTSTNQAVCTLYLGQISDANIISNTNSGSTGAPASGIIDVQDGQTLYVVWRGGDPGATATATFVGVTIPFEQIGPSNLLWDQPIAAGDGSLVFPALKSPDYVTSVSGWIIRRDGTVEFSDAVIRGSVIAANGNVVLDDDGLTIVSPDETINVSPVNGFRIDGSGNSYFAVDMIDGFGAIEFGPPDNTGTLYSQQEGAIFISSVGTGTPTEQGLMWLFPPGVNTNLTPSLVLYSESGDGTLPETIELYAAQTIIDSGVLVDGNLTTFLRGERGTALMTFAAAAVSTQVVLFSNPFPVGVTPNVFCNIESSVAAVARWTVQAYNISNTGFTILAQKGAAADANQAWTNIPVGWMAVI